MLTSLEKLGKKMESTCFNSKSLLSHDRYFNVHYEVKVTDLNSLSAVSIPEVKSLVKHARALKRKLNKHDKSLISANGLHMRSPHLQIHHEFNKETMEKVEKKKEKLGNLLQSMVQNLSQIKQMFTSIPLKSNEKRKKRKNVQKAKKRKKQRLDKRCKDVYEKIVMSLPLQEDTSLSMEHDISKHGLNIKAMACDVTSHDSKALVELKERGVFSRPAWNLLSNLVPPIVLK